MEGTGGRAGGLESGAGHARYSVTENSDMCRMGGGSASLGRQEMTRIATAWSVVRLALYFAKVVGLVGLPR